MSSELNLLNRIIDKFLPELNQKLGEAIKSDHLDPYANVASGHVGGSAASASYSLRDLEGLSSTEVTELKVTSVSSGTDSSKLTGTISMAVKLNSDLSVRIGGKAKALFVHVGLSGTATLDGVTAASGGSFMASVDGSKICLDDLTTQGLSVNYSSAHADIDGLGPLNYLLSPLEDAVLNALKGTVRGLISSQVASALNDQLDDLLPQCTSLL